MARPTINSLTKTPNNFSFRTENKNQKGLLGSLNEKAKPIIKLYGSVGGQSKRALKLYGSVGGQTKFVQ